ncbi:PstS family phosphate ABC transporter substrate-binding protein [Flavobacterium silvaticum]|nr:substrate-binding domain-containing protein [Flavobacterium silvaticum]
MCNRTGKSETETILKGSATVVVDETLLPILEDEKMVFESTYDAKINLKPRSEAEAIQALLKDSAQIVVLARNLNSEELKFFSSAQRYPKVTPFAKDAIALIGNLNRKDSTIALSEVLDFMKGKSSSSFKGLVFDNPNSGTVQYMNNLAGIKNAPEKGIYSFKTNAEVLKYVAENPDMIGIIGINWIVQPSPEVQSYLKNIQVLDVQGVGKQGFYAPSQNNLAEGTYPLARQLYFVNVQGYDGLGMGFASFIAGERGQRIILQSGLLPEHMPSRKIVTRKTL